MVETVEPKVQDLREEARRSLRNVRKKLSEIRRLTGIDEVASLGSLIGEVWVQDAPSTPKDPRLAQALQRGAIIHDQLISAEGGSLSAEETARELRMSKVAVLKRYKAGRLLAWQEERQNAYRFPAWQFHHGRVINGLEDVLAILNRQDHLDDAGRLFFFLSKSRFLGGKTPLECLRGGELHKVMQAAEGYGQ